MRTKRAKATVKTPGVVDEIADYASRQTAEHAAICRALRAEIEAALPQAASRMWHAMPVWFIGENPVVGYNLTAKRGVNLLFWSGQSFQEVGLAAAGKFRAAQIQLTEVSQIDRVALRRWLGKAGKDIWDYRGHFTAQKALQREARRPTRRGRESA